jgi:hypothetical protein
MLMRKDMSVRLSVRVFGSVLVTLGSTNGDAKTKWNLNDFRKVVADHPGSFTANLLRFIVVIIIIAVLGNVMDGHTSRRVTARNSESSRGRIRLRL